LKFSSELRIWRIITLGTVANLGYGSYQVFVGALTVGGLVASYSYIARLFDPLKRCGGDLFSSESNEYKHPEDLEVIDLTPAFPIDRSCPAYRVQQKETSSWRTFPSPTASATPSCGS